MSGVVIDVQARNDNAKRDLDEIKRSLDNIRKSSETTSSSLRGFTKSLASMAGVGAVFATIVKANSDFTNLANKIALVTGRTAALLSTQEQLINVSVRTRSDLGATAMIFSTLGKSVKESQRDFTKLVSVTETLQQAVAISGASADSANAALVQLGQGMSAGALRGEELNSVMEQTPRIAQAIADSVGTSLGGLRAMGAQGKITTEIVMKAMQTQAAKIAKEFTHIDPTLAQGFTQAQTSLNLFVYELDQGLGLTAGIGKYLSENAAEMREAGANIRASALAFMTVARSIGGGFMMILRPAFDIVKNLWTQFNDSHTYLGFVRTLKGDTFVALREIDSAFGGLFGRMYQFARFFKQDLFDFDSPVEKAVKSLRRLSPNNWATGGLDAGTLYTFFSAKTLYAYSNALADVAKAVKTNSTVFTTALLDNFRRVRYAFRDVLRYLSFTPDTLLNFKIGDVAAFTDSFTELGRGFTGMQRKVFDLQRIFDDFFGSTGVQTTNWLKDLALDFPFILGDSMVAVLGWIKRTIVAVKQIYGDLMGTSPWFGDNWFNLGKGNTFKERVVNITEAVRTSLVRLRDSISSILGSVGSTFRKLSLSNLFSKLSGGSTLSFYVNFPNLKSADRAFRDFIGSVTGQSRLSLALQHIKDFAVDVILWFREIWDKVIGNSWWTDMIDSVVDQADSLLSRVGRPLSRFSGFVKSSFKDIYETVSARIGNLEIGEVFERAWAPIDRVVKRLRWMNLELYVIVTGFTKGVIVGGAAILSIMALFSGLAGIVGIFTGATTGVGIFVAILTTALFPLFGLLRGVMLLASVMRTMWALPLVGLILYTGTLGQLKRTMTRTLTDTLATLQKWGKAVIEVFRDIWDKVIGHSWWTDTMDGVVRKAEELSGRVKAPFRKFSQYVKEAFKDLAGRDFKFGNMNGFAFKPTISGKFEAFKTGLGEAFTSVAVRFPETLRTVLVGLTGLLVAAMLPVSVLRTQLLTIIVTSFVLGAALVAERFAKTVAGDSLLKQFGYVMGTAVGYFVSSFLREIPQLLNGLLGMLAGFVRGFAEQLPIIGGLFSAVFSTAGLFNLAGPLGIVGLFFFGKSTGAFWLNLEATKKFAGAIASAFAFIQGMVKGTRGGVIWTFLFGAFGIERLIAVTAYLALVEGAFDSMLGNSVILKAIAAGGLIWVVLMGSAGVSQLKSMIGQAIAPAFLFIKQLIQSATGSGGVFSRMFYGAAGASGAATGVTAGLGSVFTRIKTLLKSFSGAVGKIGAEILGKAMTGGDASAATAKLKAVFEVAGKAFNSFAAKLGEEALKNNVFKKFWEGADGTAGLKAAFAKAKANFAGVASAFSTTASATGTTAASPLDGLAGNLQATILGLRASLASVIQSAGAAATGAMEIANVAILDIAAKINGGLLSITRSVGNTTIGIVASVEAVLSAVTASVTAMAVEVNLGVASVESAVKSVVGTGVLAAQEVTAAVASTISAVGTGATTVAAEAKATIANVVATVTAATADIGKLSAGIAAEVAASATLSTAEVNAAIARVVAAATAAGASVAATATATMAAVSASATAGAAAVGTAAAATAGVVTAAAGSTGLLGKALFGLFSKTALVGAILFVMATFGASLVNESVKAASGGKSAFASFFEAVAIYAEFNPWTAWTVALAPLAGYLMFKFVPALKVAEIASKAAFGARALDGYLEALGRVGSILRGLPTALLTTSIITGIGAVSGASNEMLLMLGSVSLAAHAIFSTMTAGQAAAVTAAIAGIRAWAIAMLAGLTTVFGVGTTAALAFWGAVFGPITLIVGAIASIGAVLISVFGEGDSWGEKFGDVLHRIAQAFGLIDKNLTNVQDKWDKLIRAGEKGIASSVPGVAPITTRNINPKLITSGQKDHLNKLLKDRGEIGDKIRAERVAFNQETPETAKSFLAIDKALKDFVLKLEGATSAKFFDDIANVNLKFQADRAGLAQRAVDPSAQAAYDASFKLRERTLVNRLKDNPGDKELQATLTTLRAERSSQYRAGFTQTTPEVKALQFQADRVVYRKDIALQGPEAEIARIKKTAEADLVAAVQAQRQNTGYKQFATVDAQAKKYEREAQSAVATSIRSMRELADLFERSDAIQKFNAELTDLDSNLSKAKVSLDEPLFARTEDDFKALGRDIADVQKLVESMQWATGTEEKLEKWLLQRDAELRLKLFSKQSFEKSTLNIAAQIASAAEAAGLSNMNFAFTSNLPYAAKADMVSALNEVTKAQAELRTKKFAINPDLPLLERDKLSKDFDKALIDLEKKKADIQKRIAALVNDGTTQGIQNLMNAKGLAIPTLVGMGGAAGLSKYSDKAQAKQDAEKLIAEYGSDQSALKGMDPAKASAAIKAAHKTVFDADRSMEWLTPLTPRLETVATALSDIAAMGASIKFEDMFKLPQDVMLKLQSYGKEAFDITARLEKMSPAALFSDAGKKLQKQLSDISVKSVTELEKLPKNFSDTLAAMQQFGVNSIADFFSIPEDTRLRLLQIANAIKHADTVLTAPQGTYSDSEVERQARLKAAKEKETNALKPDLLPKSFSERLAGLSQFGVSSLNEYFALTPATVDSYLKITKGLEAAELVLGDRNATAEDVLKARGDKARLEKQRDTAKDNPATLGLQLDFVKSIFSDIVLTQEDWARVSATNRAEITRLAGVTAEAARGLKDLGAGVEAVPEQQAASLKRAETALALSQTASKPLAIDTALFAGLPAQIDQALFNVLDGGQKNLIRGLAARLKQNAKQIPLADNDDLVQAAQTIYDKTAKELERALARASLKQEAYAAGQTLAQDTKSSMAEGIKNVIKGKATLAEGIKGLVTSFADKVIDTFVDGIVTSLAGPQSAIGRMVSDFGKALFSAGADVFDEKDPVSVAEDNFVMALNNFTATFGGGLSSFGKGTSLTGTDYGIGSDAMGPPTETQFGAMNPMLVATKQTTGVFASGMEQLRSAFTDPDAPLMTRVVNGLGGVGKLLSGGFGGLGNLLLQMLSTLALGGTGGGGGGGLFGTIIGLFTGGGGDLGLGTGGGMAMAKGGFIAGPGTSTSDSILSWLSNGEHVTNAASTKKYSNLLKMINDDTLPKFAKGGLVGNGMLSGPTSLTPSALSPQKGGGTSVFNINVTGDISRQTRSEIQQMIPQIAGGVNAHNYEKGNRR